MNHLLKAVFRCQVRQLSSTSNKRAIAHSLMADYGPLEVQRSTLMNGIRVAAAKSMGAGMSACTMMFQAGSRYEKDDQLGVTHFIRACSSASGFAYSGFIKTRVLQEHGVYITCSSDRQTVMFTMRCPVTLFPDMKYYLLDTASRCFFHQWEVDDRKQSIREDLMRISPSQRVIDLVQSACWAGPLSNSVFCLEDRLDDMTSDAINRFATQYYRTDRLTIAGVGLPFDEVMKLAEKSEYSRGLQTKICEGPSNPRSGYEFYDMGPGSDTWIAVAVPGCGTNDLCCLLMHAIIAAACGEDNIREGQHHMDRTLAGPLGLLAGDDVNMEFRAFNLSYMEQGLFGIMAKSPADKAWDAAMKASEFLSNIGNLTPNEIEIGRRRLKLRLSRHEDDCVFAAEGLAMQLANDCRMDNAGHTLSIINSICNSEICCVSKLLGAKSCDMALAVVGDVNVVPHDRELVRQYR